MANATELPKPKNLLTEAEAADYLSIRPQTLANWRSTRRYDLPFVRVGRVIRYRLSDLQSWLDANTVGTTAG